MIAAAKLFVGNSSGPLHLAGLVGSKAVVFGLLKREIAVKSGDRHVLLLGHVGKRSFALVVFDETVYDALDMSAYKAMYLTARGKITLYRGRPQMVIESAKDVSSQAVPSK